MTRLVSTKREEEAGWVEFYIRGGMAPDLASKTGSYATDYENYVTPLPVAITIVGNNDILSIGGRNFRALLAGGHAENQLTLYCADAGLYFSADQVISRITPHVGVEPAHIDEDPLGVFLAAARRIGSEFPADVLVVPGHELPFRGLTSRCNDLIEHHAVRYRAILDACASAPRSVTELLPVLFSRDLDRTAMPFAHGEARAHLNFLTARKVLSLSHDTNGIDQWKTSAPSADLEEIISAFKT